MMFLSSFTIIGTPKGRLEIAVLTWLFAHVAAFYAFCFAQQIYTDLLGPDPLDTDEGT